MIAHEESLYSNEVNNYLTSYDVNTLISNIAILTPDNKIVQSRRHNNTADDIMDYTEESVLGEHISDLRPSSIAKDTKVLYSFIPVRANGSIVGILFTELNPSAIAKAWSPEMYNGKASFCIINRKNGEILINDWNPGKNNVSDIGYRELTDNICSGKTGFLEIISGNTDQFVSYMPMELEDWEIVFFVDKDVVFESANRIHDLMLIFLSALSGGFIVFLVWMLWSNRRSIANAEKNANTDVLTGLQNRNRYEKKCMELNGRENGLTCIYIDANGLHEINNTKGHLAGDQMLKFIADTLKVTFGDDMTYRIGGDEFVVFLKNIKSGDLQNRLSVFGETLMINNYHASVGICSGDESITLDEIVKTAEKNMYEDKKKYYESIGKTVRNKPE